MKIFMVTDMEGVAGIVSFTDQSYPTGKYYEAGKKLVTGEVNAAIGGLVAAGVEDILVWDGHGAGAIVYEDLHPAARLLHGRMANFSATMQALVKQHDACVMIGQHAMAGVATANQNHTQSSQTVDYYKLNGRAIGETGQIALFCGALGVPLIFLSGDEAACHEAEELVPGIATAAVKQGLGRGAAISLPMARAHRLIAEGIAGAVKRQMEQPILPLRWDGPYTLEMRFFQTDTADARAALPGAQRVDAQTVRFTSDNILEVIYR
jgi:D-amino peptidase